MKASPYAGKPAEASMLVNIPKLVTAYYTDTPDPSVPEQRVAFGASGHRGSAFEKAFNEWHILAINQAICLYREHKKIDGPLFLGMDTHALSVPALAGALEVLAANGVEVMIAQADEYTPTPAISHAILTYNRGRKTRRADGSLGFGGEESAGASFIRLDGSVWTTDKDGIIPSLLAAEITARTDPDPGEIYRELTREFGEPVYDRVEAPATPEQKELLAKLSPQQVRLTDLAGEKIQTILTRALSNSAPIGGLKVITESGWFAARPSGMEQP
jgi:phosphoglucomutase